MSHNGSATGLRTNALPRGLAWGALGVVAFSLSLPTTQVAVRELGWVFATSGRAVAAAALAAAYLALRRARRPGRELLPGLLVVAAGVVVGFPLFTALALQRTDSAHGAVIVGLLPAATAILGVLRTGERPSPGFWVACAAGALSVAVFTVVRGAGLPTPADGLIVLAVLSAAVGYAEGARLAPLLGSDQVICWALLLSVPMLLPVLVVDVAGTAPTAGVSGWACFAYTAVVSMFLGFFAWYRGLALGGVAKVSQVQLIQPLLTVAASVALFGQYLDPAVFIAALAVLACVATAQRTRVIRTHHVASDGGGGHPPQTAPPGWHDRGMARIRLSTTVDADLLEGARSVRSGSTDASLVDEALAALLARNRCAEVDASYSAYDDHPLNEPDEWGDLASFRRAAAAS